MNQTPADSTGSRRPKPMLIICVGIIFGAVAFWAGRLSVQLGASRSGSKPASATRQSLLANSRGSVGPEVVTSSANAQTNLASKASPSWDENRWSELMAKPGTVARNAALADLLEKLAATDPQRAMALAQAEGNLKLRADLQQAALRGWASTAPADAAHWALALPNQSDRSNAMKTVFSGAVAVDPDGAVRVVKLMMQQDPGGDVSYGSSLIDALCVAGNFETAAKFAAEGTDSQRSFWLAESYSKWAELQPEEAAAAALSITDPDIQMQALHGVAGGWAQADPVALVQVMAQLPPGANRGSMVGQALEQWIRLNPDAAADWIRNNDLGADLDQSKKALANMDLFTDKIQPDVAANWAESIHDPAVRSEALTNLLRDWVLKDMSAAKRYFDSTTNLLPADRQQVSETIASLSRNAAK